MVAPVIVPVRVVHVPSRRVANDVPVRLVDHGTVLVAFVIRRSVGPSAIGVVAHAHGSETQGQIEAVAELEQPRHVVPLGVGRGVNFARTQRHQGDCMTFQFATCSTNSSSTPSNGLIASGKGATSEYVFSHSCAHMFPERWAGIGPVGSNLSDPQASEYLCSTLMCKVKLRHTLYATFREQRSLESNPRMEFFVERLDGLPDLLHVGSEVGVGGEVARVVV